MIRVLVADDQALMRGGFRMILDAQDDIEVVGEAIDGARRRRAVRRSSPDVVVMDVRMPAMDGIEATRRLTAADPPARVLILTTFDLDEYVYEALRAGASGFLLKDRPPEELVAAVRVVAAGEALLAPSGHAPADRGVRAAGRRRRRTARGPRRRSPIASARSWC